jgi:hypothetical protein
LQNHEINTAFSDVRGSDWTLYEKLVNSNIFQPTLLNLDHGVVELPFKSWSSVALHGDAVPLFTDGGANGARSRTAD